MLVALHSIVCDVQATSSISEFIYQIPVPELPYAAEGLRRSNRDGTRRQRCYEKVTEEIGAHPMVAVVRKS
jgi:hypothetical protein